METYKSTTAAARPPVGVAIGRHLGDLLRRALDGGPPVRRRLALLAFLGGLAWAFLLFLRSPGAPTHDEIAHYLIARHAWTSPVFILDDWGRPGYTLLFMPAAAASWTAARVFALGLSCLTVLFAVRLARQLGATSRWTVPLFCWFQPWFASLSFTALTEVPFSLLGVVGASLALDGRMGLAGVAFGLLPLARAEGILLTGLFALLCVARRHWSAVATSALPMATYNLVSYVVRGGWPFEMYGRPKVPDIYGTGTGGWLYYFGPLLDEVGLAIAVLAVLAVAAMPRGKAHLLVFAGYGAYLLMHVVLYRFGLFNAGGWIRYLFPLAPIIAVAAALGLDVALRALDRVPGAAARWALRGVLLGGIVALVLAIGVTARRPHRVDPEQAVMREAGAWLRQQGLDRERVVSTHVWLYYYLALPVDPRGAWSHPPRLDSLGAGTVVVWDGHYSEIWGLPRAGLLEPGGNWVLLREFGDRFVLVFQRR